MKRIYKVSVLSTALITLTSLNSTEALANRTSLLLEIFEGTLSRFPLVKRLPPPASEFIKEDRHFLAQPKEKGSLLQEEYVARTSRNFSSPLSFNQYIPLSPIALNQSLFMHTPKRFYSTGNVLRNSVREESLPLSPISFNQHLPLSSITFAPYLFRLHTSKRFYSTSNVIQESMLEEGTKSNRIVEDTSEELVRFGEILEEENKKLGITYETRQKERCQIYNENFFHRVPFARVPFLASDPLEKQIENIKNNCCNTVKNDETNTFKSLSAPLEDLIDIVTTIYNAKKRKEFFLLKSRDITVKFDEVRWKLEYEIKNISLNPKKDNYSHLLTNLMLIHQRTSLLIHSVAKELFR